jgi:3-hydroxybutyryl-CoA dehydrogenase
VPVFIITALYLYKPIACFMTINTICICGAGTMGRGIAQVAAQAGYYTILFDVNSTVLQEAASRLEKDLQLLVDRNKITTAVKETILQHLRFTTDNNDCIADIVIEAIVEKEAVKVGLFNQLAELNHSETIFATNTSSLSVTAIAEKVMHPQRVVGMHFFNPAPVMKLVEVVATPVTLPAVVTQVVALAKAMGKTPVVCKDAPGFIVNHVARPYYLEALRLVEAGHADYATIDALMEASGFKMGPFKLMDLIGNDINYAVSCLVYDQLQQTLRLKPSAIQAQKVASNELGKKTGKGYYQY